MTLGTRMVPPVEGAGETMIESQYSPAGQVTCIDYGCRASNRPSPRRTAPDMEGSPARALLRKTHTPEPFF